MNENMKINPGDLYQYSDHGVIRKCLKQSGCWVTGFDPCDRKKFEVKTSVDDPSLKVYRIAESDGGGQ